MLTDAEVFDRTTRLRRLIADTVTELEPGQWNAATLCRGWDVRTLVAHLCQPMLVGFNRMALTAIGRRGNIDAAIDATARRLARRPPEELVAVLREHAGDPIAPPKVGPYGPFVDACVHLRDMARPLGLDADATTDDWIAVLDHLMSPTVSPYLIPKGRIEGIRFRATDAPWAGGAGAELDGPLEALALAATGRRVACADLAGPGLKLLQWRLDRPA